MFINCSLYLQIVARGLKLDGIEVLKCLCVKVLACLCLRKF